MLFMGARDTVTFAVNDPQNNIDDNSAMSDDRAGSGNCVNDGGDVDSEMDGFGDACGELVDTDDGADVNGAALEADELAVWLEDTLVVRPYTGMLPISSGLESSKSGSPTSSSSSPDCSNTNVHCGDPGDEDEDEDEDTDEDEDEDGDGDKMELEEPEDDALNESEAEVCVTDVIEPLGSLFLATSSAEVAAEAAVLRTDVRAAAAFAVGPLTAPAATEDAEVKTMTKD